MTPLVNYEAILNPSAQIYKACNRKILNICERDWRIDNSLKSSRGFFQVHHRSREQLHELGGELQRMRYLLKVYGKLGFGTLYFAISGCFNEWKENKITMRRIARLKVMVLYRMVD